jgi:hypothetical protein
MRAFLLAFGLALVASCGQASSPTARQMPSPSAPASPTPLTSPIKVPDSAPLIMYHDPANFDQLDAVTWDGKSSGKVGLGVNRGGSGNPQGTLYSTANDLRDRGGAAIVASHDSQYIALDPAPGSPTTIYGRDGSVAGTTPDEVFSFSWDGALTVVAGSFGSKPSIVDWHTNRTIWSCPNGQLKYWQAFAEPGGSHMAVGVLDPAYPQTRGFAHVDLFVVGADGRVIFERNNATLFQY